ncbi:MAG: PrsW family intramembrane metalloprotease [Anaerolineae bacterium]|nr:PrsW family intramembrane metalloprotease [Anaerolineae bacterium]
MVVISLVIAVAIPILFLILLRRFDLYATGKASFNLATLFGGIVAYLLAAQINTMVDRLDWATWDQIVRYVAPVVEEILKSIILIYIVNRADFNYVVDGALYGFGAGIGFAVIENFQYITDPARAGTVLLVAVMRVFSTNLMHATGSGLIGTGLAFGRGDISRRARIGVALAGYGFAILNHMGFNILVNMKIATVVLLVFAIVMGVTGAALIWYIIRRGMRIQKEWVSEKLGMADRVTQQETKMVRNIETVDEVLSPVQQRFGSAKASLVRSLIYKQAEIGIKRKLLDAAPNEARKADIEAIIQDLGKDVQDLRNRIGAYCMLLVREVYLGTEGQMWNLLNSRIAAAGPNQKGGGLWDRMTERVKRTADEVDPS